MKTAGKRLFNVFLSFVIAVSCLIGIGMTSLAVTYESVYVGQVIKYEETFTATEGVGYAISSESTHFFHDGVVYTVTVVKADDGNEYYGLSYTYRDVRTVDLIDSAPVTDGSEGLKVVSGNGKDEAFTFGTYSPVDDVNALIDALPDPDEVIATETGINAIEKAREAYDKLEEALQVKVGEDRLAKLEACEEALEEARADKKVAEGVQELVDKLPDPEDVTEDDRADIEAARAAFTKLTDKQKQYMNINKLIADENQLLKNKAAVVVDLIDAIGKVELTDECDAKIKAARKAYEALTDDERRYVDNFNDMTAAEEEYLALSHAAAVKETEDAIKALPDADKLSIDDYYDVYDAANLYYNLPDNAKANVNADLKKKLDASVETIYSITLEVGEQLFNDYGDYLDEEYVEYANEVIDAAKKVVSEGRTPTYFELEDLIFTVVVADYELYNTYLFTSGANAEWVLGSVDPMVFRILQAGINSKHFDNTFYSFDLAGQKIYIDGALVDSKYFTAAEGSVILTIMPEYLNTLSAGEHTLTVLFDNSVTVTTKITVRAPASVPSSGETVSQYVILGVSVLLLAGAVLGMRKRLVGSDK